MINILYGFIILYLLACLGLWAQQRRLLYFPTPEAALPNVDITTLENDGEQLKIIRLPPTASVDNHLAILYFGGNGEAVELNIPEFTDQLSNSPLGSTVYLMNYRGYGGSSGKPTEQGLYKDALALYDSVKERHTNIAVIGRSLGTGVATYVAANREVSKLALITAFDSIVSIAVDRFSVFPVRLLMQDQFSSINRTSQIKAPTLLLTAGADTVVPRQHTERLKSAFPNGQVEETLFPGKHHNDLQTDPEYYDTLVNFLAS